MPLNPKRPIPSQKLPDCRMKDREELAKVPETRGATAEDVVGLYRILLGRPPQSEAVVLGQLGRPLLELAIDIACSDEFRALARRATEKDVVQLYRDFLGRAPDSNGAIEKMGRPLLEIAAEVALSEEFWRRQLLQPVNLRSLYERFCPSPRLPIEWFKLFSKIANANGTSLEKLQVYFQEMALHARGQSTGYPQVAQSLITSKEPLKNFDSRITVVVPTVNSASWLGCLIDHYDELGIPVMFAVDARTSDGTREVITNKGGNFVDVFGEHPRVESLMYDIVAKVKSPWILRLDDDEVPSPALLRFVEKAIDGSTEFTWGFPRVSLRYDKGRRELQYSQFLAVGPIGGADRQWRLFSRDGVTLIDCLHTPGFVPNSKRLAPADAMLFHFDWVLRSLGERIKKVRSYEAQDPVSARALASFALYEMVPESWHMFVKLTYGPYVKLAKKLFHASSRTSGC